MNYFFEEHRQLLKLLVKHEVSFMLVGGYAVIYHGYERSTGDMDIWLEKSNQNKEKLIRALIDYGISNENINQLNNIDFEQIPPLFFIGEAPRRIDFITVVQNVDFKDAISTAHHIAVDDIEVPVINFKNLILSKISSKRLKDKADVEELQRINKYRNKND